MLLDPFSGARFILAEASGCVFLSFLFIYLFILWHKSGTKQVSPNPPQPSSIPHWKHEQRSGAFFRRGCVNSGAVGWGASRACVCVCVPPFTACAGSSYCSGTHLFRPGSGFYGYKSVVVSSGALFRLRQPRRTWTTSHRPPAAPSPPPPRALERRRQVPSSGPALCPRRQTPRIPWVCSHPYSSCTRVAPVFLPVPLSRAQFKSLFFLPFLSFPSV